MDVQVVIATDNRIIARAQQRRTIIIIGRCGQSVSNVEGELTIFASRLKCYSLTFSLELKLDTNILNPLGTRCCPIDFLFKLISESEVKRTKIRLFPVSMGN